MATGTIFHRTQPIEFRRITDTKIHGQTSTNPETAAPWNRSGVFRPLINPRAKSESRKRKLERWNRGRSELFGSMNSQRVYAVWCGLPLRLDQNKHSYIAPSRNETKAPVDRCVWACRWSASVGCDWRTKHRRYGSRMRILRRKKIWVLILQPGL